MTFPLDAQRTEVHVTPRRVYVTNYGFHNYDDLHKHGEVHAITRGRIDIRYTDRLRATIVEALREMKPDDYICPSGPLVVNIEVAAIVMNKFGHINYLYFEALYGKYLKRHTNGTAREIPDGRIIEPDADE